MKNTIPGEIFNQVGVPVYGTSPTLISSYIEEMAYKLPSVTDVMMTKMYWETLCDFADRCGTLREQISGDISSSNLSLVVSSTQFGRFQRFVGVYIDNIPAGFDLFTTGETESGPSIVFNASVLPVAGSTRGVKADISVVPNILSAPSYQKAPRWFLDKYEQVLIHGTLFRLQSMSGRPWFDEAAARMHATAYMSEINRLTHGIITSGMRKSIALGIESVIARQSTTSTTNSTTSTVG